MKKSYYGHSLSGLICVFLAFVHCSGGSTSSNTVTLGAEATGSALGALFSGNQNQAAATLIRNLETSQDICQNLAASPGKVFTSGRAAPGTYGANGDTVTLAATDFCQTADGTDQTVEGETPGTRFAQFTFLDTLIGDCSQDGNSSTITMLRGSGVVRNTDNYFPEIYGNFEIGEEISRCTLRMNSSGEIISTASSCTSSSGDTIRMDPDLSCTMQADLDRIDISLPIEGHMSATSSASSYSLSYGCFETYPLITDANGFLQITSDCSALNAFGFNLEALTYTLAVTGDENRWGFEAVDNLSDVLSRAKILRLNGYPVLLKVNFIYAADYDGTNNEVLDPSSEFPQALIDNDSFNQDLISEIVDVAVAAEHAKIELLAPVSEIDRIFSQTAELNSDATFTETLLNEVLEHFNGELVAIYRELSSDDPSLFKVENFNYMGITLTPLADHVSFTEFQDHVGEQLTRLQSIANAYSLPYFIAGAGVFGDATDDANSYDWDSSSEIVLDVFQELYDRSQTFSTNGIIFGEGFPGDVVFSNYPDLQSYISGLFEPVMTDTDVDGEYDPNLSTLSLDWDLLSGPLDVAKGMTMAAYDGKLYVFGGSSQGTGRRTQIYNIATDSWTSGSNMPRYRESAVSAEVNGKIYVIGGNDPDTCSGNYRCAQLSEVDVYDPALDSWRAVASLNERRDVAGAVVYDDKIYVVGGMYSESGDVQVSNRDSLEVYDPVTNRWTVLNRDIPYPIRSAATAIAGDVIYVIGGCAEHGSNLDELEAENTCSQTVVQTYDIGDGTWAVMENNMPTGRHFSGQHAISNDAGILVFGGATDLGSTSYNVVEGLNFSTTSWTYGTGMQAQRKSSASIFYNGYLYVTGGADHGQGYSNALDSGMERAYIGDL